MRAITIISAFAALAAGGYVIASVYWSKIVDFAMPNGSETWCLGMAICHACAFLISASAISTGRALDGIAMAAAGFIAAMCLWFQWAATTNWGPWWVVASPTAPWQAAVAAAAFGGYGTIVALYLLLTQHNDDADHEDEHDKITYMAWKRGDMHISSITWFTMFLCAYQQKDLVAQITVGAAAAIDMLGGLIGQSCLRQGHGTSKGLALLGVLAAASGSVPMYFWWKRWQGDSYNPDVDMYQRVFVTWIAMLIVRLSPVIGAIIAATVKDAVADQFVAPTISIALAAYTICDQLFFNGDGSIGVDDNSRWWTITLFANTAFVFIKSRMISRADGIAWATSVMITICGIWAAYQRGQASFRLAIVTSTVVFPAIIIAIIAAIDSQPARKWNDAEWGRWLVVAVKRVDLHLAALAWWITMPDFSMYAFGVNTTIPVAALLIDTLLLIVTIYVSMSFITSVVSIMALAAAISWWIGMYDPQTWYDITLNQPVWYIFATVRVLPFLIYVLYYLSRAVFVTFRAAPLHIICPGFTIIMAITIQAWHWSNDGDYSSDNQIVWNVLIMISTAFMVLAGILRSRTDGIVLLLSSSLLTLFAWLAWLDECATFELAVIASSWNGVTIIIAGWCWFGIVAAPLPGAVVPPQQTCGEMSAMKKFDLHVAALLTGVSMIAYLDHFQLQENATHALIMMNIVGLSLFIDLVAAYVIHQWSRMARMQHMWTLQSLSTIITTAGYTYPHWKYIKSPNQLIDAYEQWIYPLFLAVALIRIISWTTHIVLTCSRGGRHGGGMYQPLIGVVADEIEGDGAPAPMLIHHGTVWECDLGYDWVAYDDANTELINEAARSASWPVFVRIGRQHYQVDSPSRGVYVQIDLATNQQRRIRMVPPVLPFPDAVPHVAPVAPVGYIPPPVVIGLVRPASPVSPSINRSIPFSSSPTVSSRSVTAPPGGPSVGAANLSPTGTLLWPAHWTPPIIHEGGARTTLIPLDEKSTEYRDVAGRFNASLPDHIIDRIDRVQAPHLWQSYQLKRRQLGGYANEHRLYHGTRGKDKVDGISQNGFNRSFAGDVNGRVYGAGVYFGLSAVTSSNYTDSKDGTMFEASVLVGNVTVGNASMKAPPPLPQDPHGRSYDSTTDNLMTPSLFVTYHDDQAVPDYLISFHQGYHH